MCPCIICREIDVVDGLNDSERNAAALYGQTECFYESKV